MYTIANKHNKKTRKLPSSSRNKHKSKSKSKNKRKHKYTIGKTRKYTKSHNTIHMRGGILGKVTEAAKRFVHEYKQNRGMNDPGGSFPQQQEREIEKYQERQRILRGDPPLSQPPMADQTQTQYRAPPQPPPDTRKPPPQVSKTSPRQVRSTRNATEKPVTPAPVFTFDQFNQKVNEIIGKLNTEGDTIHDTLFIDLTTAATKITDPDQQKNAILIVETMYMFYSNNFPQVGKRIENAIKRKSFNVKFAPLDNEALFKKRLVTLGLNQEGTPAIAETLKKEANQHTVQTTINEKTNLNPPQVISALSTLDASTSASSAPPSAAAPPVLPVTSASSAVDANAAAAKWDEWNRLTNNSTGNNYIVKVAKYESQHKYSDGYRILFRSDGEMFAWGKNTKNILQRLALLFWKNKFYLLTAAPL